MIVISGLLRCKAPNPLDEHRQPRSPSPSKQTQKFKIYAYILLGCIYHITQSLLIIYRASRILLSFGLMCISRCVCVLNKVLKKSVANKVEQKKSDSGFEFTITPGVRVNPRASLIAN